MPVKLQQDHGIGDTQDLFLRNLKRYQTFSQALEKAYHYKYTNSNKPQI